MQGNDVTTFQTSKNAATYHDATAHLYPGRTAVVSQLDGEQVTYQELAAHINRYGNAISSLGVPIGERVALFLPNDLTHIYTFFGAMRMGSVPALVNTELPDSSIRYIVDDCGASVLITSDAPDQLRKAHSATATIDSVQTVAVDAADPHAAIKNAGLTADIEADVVSLPELVEQSSPSLEPADVSSHDPALQPYTSGSTGKPKGCIISHGGIKWNIEAVVKVTFADETDCSILAAPLHHKNAWLSAVKPMLLTGGTCVVLPEFDTASIIEAIDAHGVTYLTGVPSMYKMIVNDVDSLEDKDVSSVEWGIVGSEPVPEPLLEQCQTVFEGVDMLEAYGLTESGPVTTYSPRFGVRKHGSAGLALPKCETKIVDPATGEELPPGEVGEILITNPTVDYPGPIYHDRPDTEADVLEQREGSRWIHTDDLGRKDDDGYHYIVGRLDDMLIVGGENVYPAEVENLLSGHPAVADVAVVGAPHETKGEAPVAFVVQETDADVAEADLKEFALENGPAYAHPRRVFLREKLPLSGTRKIDYDRLRQEVDRRIDTL